MDNLVTCNRCGGNACYEQKVDDSTTTWLCMGCGFTTSTQLLKESKLYNDTMESAPELYKDLVHIDESGKAWVPSTITLPGKGMVFIDGTSKSDWKWAAVRAVPITEDDRKLKQYPDDQTVRMDMKNASKFDQKNFMDALEVIGFFQPEL
jgi:hypothetical protein